MGKKQELAEREHKKFIDFMYPHFGLEDKPNYCEVYFRPLPAMGILQGDPWRIAINYRYKLKKDRDKIVHTVWHESSHYLHHLKNPSLQLMEIPKDESDEEHDERIHLIEGVADLGALLTLKEFEGLDYNQTRRYHMKKNRDFPDNKLDEEHMLTWVIAMRNPSLLEKIASKKVPEAREIMNQHREEALIYVNSICRKGLEVPDDFSCYSDE